MDSDQVWKWASLIIFCLQNSITPIVFRFAMTEATKGDRASTSWILFFTEAIKFVVSYVLLVLEHNGDVRKSFDVIHQDALSNPRENLPLGVPSLIYVLQNALLQWSSGNMSAALFQVTYQGKILVTAAFSVILLQKQIKRVQWLSIIIMGTGIAMVQLADAKESKQSAMANASEQNVVAGVSMLLLACCCSGFASVFTEKVLKQVGGNQNQKKKSVWLQNMQMAFFSMGVCLFSAASEVLFPEQGTENRIILHGFTWKTWMMAANNAIGGLLVALVIKYADNILRGFASAVATISTAILSVFLFGFELKAVFAVGSLMVIGSTMLYGGVIKLPTDHDWWNSESDFCRVARTKNPSEDASAMKLPISEKDTKEVVKRVSPREKEVEMALQPRAAA
jgi:UDP-sugar transporter A1/2/3